MTERQRRLWLKSDADVHAILSRQCIPEFGQPDDVARMALFLASDDAKLLTKKFIMVGAGAI